MMLNCKRRIAVGIAAVLGLCTMPAGLSTVNAADKEFGDEEKEISIYVENGVATSDESTTGWSYANNTVTIEHGYTCSVYAFDEGVDVTVDNHGVLYDVNSYITKLINESDGACDGTAFDDANIINYGVMVECSFYNNYNTDPHIENHGTLRSCYVDIPTTNYEGGFIDQDVWFYNGNVVSGNAGIIRCGFTKDTWVPGMENRYIDVVTGSKITSPSIENDDYVNLGWRDNHNYWGYDLGYIDFDQLEIRVPHEFYADTREKVSISVAGDSVIEKDNLQRQCRANVYPYVTGDTNVTWTVEGANDPATTIDSTGLLTVSPLETASKIKVRGTSVSNPSLSTAKEFTIRLPRITTPEVLPEAAVNEPYSIQLEYSGDQNIYKMSSALSKLPEGLVIDPDGTLHGTISKTGTYNVVIGGSATYNPNSYMEKCTSVGKSFTLTVKNRQTLDTSSFQNVSKYAFAKSFTQTVTGPEDGGAITYTSSDPNVATVDSTTGEVTPVREGAAVITATAAETLNYLPAAASYTVTVEKTPTPNTSTGVETGDHQTITLTENTDPKLEVEFYMDMDQVLRVSMDNKELTLNQDFTMRRGSTIITLTPEYLKSLSAGEHTLAIFSDHDYKSSVFQIAEPAVEPKKEDTKPAPSSTDTKTEPAVTVDPERNAASPETSAKITNNEDTARTNSTPETAAAVNTGDQTNAVLFAVLLVLSVSIGLTAFVFRNKKRFDQ